MSLPACLRSDTIRAFQRWLIVCGILGGLTVTGVAMALELHGHRGARGLRPENTLSAFATALTIGVDALEMDVGLTADDVVVVMHDRDLNPLITRDAGGNFLAHAEPAVRSLTFAELMAFDVGRIAPGSDYAEKFPDQLAVDGSRVPSLEQVIGLIGKARNSRVRLNIEVKVSAEHPGATVSPETFADVLVGVLRGAGVAPRTIVQSFEWRVPRRVQAIAPEITTAYLTSGQPWFDSLQAGQPGASPWTAGFDVDEFGGSVPRMVRAAGGGVWAPYYGELSRAELDEAHALGLKVIVWTVNEESAMRTMIGLPVDGIITDYPDRARAVMKSLGLALPDPTPVAP